MVTRRAWQLPVGVVLVLNEMKIRFDEVILDDVEDERFPRVLERWQREGLDTFVVETATGRHLVARSRLGESSARLPLPST